MERDLADPELFADVEAATRLGKEYQELMENYEQAFEHWEQINQQWEEANQASE